VQLSNEGPADLALNIGFRSTIGGGFSIEKYGTLMFIADCASDGESRYCVFPRIKA